MIKVNKKLLDVPNDVPVYMITTTIIQYTQIAHSVRGGAISACIYSTGLILSIRSAVLKGQFIVSTLCVICSDV